MNRFEQIYKQIIAESSNDTKYTSLAGYAGVVLGTDITKIIKAISSKISFDELVYTYKKEAPSDEYDIINDKGIIWLLYPYSKNNEQYIKSRNNAINMLIKALTEISDTDALYDLLKQAASTYEEDTNNITSMYDIIKILIDYSPNIDVLFAYI